MRITYLILAFTWEVIFFVTALLAPIYITPGWYFWTVFCIVMMFAVGSKMSDRIDEWNKFDALKAAYNDEDEK